LQVERYEEGGGNVTIRRSLHSFRIPINTDISLDIVHDLEYFKKTMYMKDLVVVRTRDSRQTHIM
jgi:hypothetical protein